MFGRRSAARLGRTCTTDSIPRKSRTAADAGERGPNEPSSRLLPQHVVLDQPGGAFGDEAVQRLQARGDMVVRIDRLAHVVQQCGQQEFLVVRQFVAGQIEDLQAVVQRIAFGMVPRVLLDVLQRQQQRFVDLKTVDAVLPARAIASFEVHVGILAREQLFQFGNAGPLDRFAGDRALEDVVGLVGGVDRQLEGKSVRDMNVREDAFLAVFADPFALDVVDHSLVVQRSGHGVDAVGEDVQVDVRAARRGRSSRCRSAAVGIGAGSASCGALRAACRSRFSVRLVAFVQSGQGLDFVADLGVAGQIGRLDPAATDAAGGLHSWRGSTPTPAAGTSDGRLPRRSAAAVSKSSSRCRAVSPLPTRGL